MSLDKTKTDSKLGKDVNLYLTECGVQTPMSIIHNFSKEDKIDNITQSFTNIMKSLELDIKDDSLKETPKRVAKMYINDLFWGLDPDNFPKATVIENKMNYDEMVLEKNISVKSCCEHHFMPFFSFNTIGANIAYIPKNKVLGLSKLNRIVEYFSRRPQVQERLTEQIYHALAFILGTEDVAVVIEAEHTCVKMRGVEDDNGKTITSKLGGAFKSQPQTRAEFMRLIQ